MNRMPFILESKYGKVTHKREDSLFVIGERINPSSNPMVLSALRQDENDSLLKEAEEQVRCGAQAIDVNVGVGHDQAECMRKTVRYIQERLKVPLVLDSARPEVLKAGLEESGGRVLLNSITGEERSLRTLIPLARKYQVPFVGLTIDEKGLPQTHTERLHIADKIVTAALAAGIPKEDIVIDPVLLPVSFYPDQVFETLKALKSLREAGVTWTCLGISNVSFGLKKRKEVNLAPLI